MYFTSLPDHSNPGFDEQLHFSKFGKTNVIFNAKSNIARCDNHVGCFSIKTVTEGVEWYGVDGRMMAVRPGQFLILNDLQEYSCRIDDGPVRTLSVFFRKKLTSSVHRDVRQSDETLLDNPFEQGHIPEILQTIRQLDDNLHVDLTRLVKSLDHDGYDDNRVDEQLLSLLDHFFRVYQGDVVASKKVDAIKASTQKEIYKRLCIARDVLNSFYNEKTDLDAVSIASCLSIPQLVRQFKIVFGTTPHRYLATIRMQRAAEMLRTTDKPVADIAWSCGFENASAFSRAFKRKYGVSARNL